MKIASVYIHIPFCLRKCNYCDFVSYPLADCSTVRGHYPQLVLQELELYREELDFSPLRTIYFGGWHAIDTRGCGDITATGSLSGSD